MKRMQNRATRLRELLIAERERSLDRWLPSRPDERLAALRAGEAVIVSSWTTGGARA